MNTNIRKNFSIRNCQITLLLLLLLGSSTIFADTPIRLNAGTTEPFITADGGGFYGELMREVFSRINIQAKVIRLPSKRSLLNANQGIDDGQKHNH